MSLRESAILAAVSIQSSTYPLKCIAISWNFKMLLVGQKVDESLAVLQRTTAGQYVHFTIIGLSLNDLSTKLTVMEVNKLMETDGKATHVCWLL